MSDAGAAGFVARERDAIAEAAAASVERTDTGRYGAAGSVELRRRLDALLDRLLASLERRDLGPMLAYARELGRERFEQGYELGELQTVFHALEQAIWIRAFAAAAGDTLWDALLLPAAILAAGNDAVAREYVALASHAHTPALDVQALFAGTERRP